jgi:hypothetical protein
MSREQTDVLIEKRRKFAALLANGCVQHWVEEYAKDEQQFRDFLNTNYPFYICLYCESPMQTEH